MARRINQDAGWNKRRPKSKVYATGTRPTYDKLFKIYCEGKNTEPYYFRSFPVYTAQVDAIGYGRSKTSLVQYVIDVLEAGEKSNPKREVWIVFDRDFDPTKNIADQKDDFNRAIQLAERHSYKVAYSNDSFELWFVLHYQTFDAQLTRVQFYEFLSNHLRIPYEREGKTRKFCANIYVDLKPSQEAAIQRAERLHQQQQGALPSDQNPCTTVHHLVRELNKYLKK